MFRFFLTKKLFAGNSREVAARDRQGINRRMSERYSFEHRHVTMMSDQDIMVVREVSETGFSSIVSPRTWDRMVVGDGYESRMRLGSNVLDFTIRVAWKDRLLPDNSVGRKAGDAPSQPVHFLGFELMVDSEEGMRGLAGEQGSAMDEWRRLIRPAALAASLRRVDSAFMAEFGSEKIWYHGDDGCDLMIWRAPGATTPMAWRLSFDAGYVEWRDGFGFETGKTPDLTPGTFSSGLGYPGIDVPGLPVLKNGSGKQIEGIEIGRMVGALDILVASDVDEASFLIESLEGELARHGQGSRTKLG